MFVFTVRSVLGVTLFCFQISLHAVNGLSTDCVVLLVAHVAPGSLRQSARPYINFEAQVDWHQRHEFLKCTCGLRSIYLTSELT